MTKIIEAEYQVPDDTVLGDQAHRGLAHRQGRVRCVISNRHTTSIKWGRLHVKWHKDGHVFEYEPTAEDHGDGIDFKWPDAEYIDGERMD